MTDTEVLPIEDTLNDLDFAPRCCITWVSHKDRSKDRDCPATATHFATFIGFRGEDSAIACTDCVAQMRHRGELLKAEPLK